MEGRSSEDAPAAALGTRCTTGLGGRGFMGTSAAAAGGGGARDAAAVLVVVFLAAAIFLDLALGFQSSPDSSSSE